MYHLTIIRLNSNTKVFQNTEFNSLCLKGDVLIELNRLQAEQEIINEFNVIEVGVCKTLEVENQKHLWFCYITRIS